MATYCGKNCDACTYREELSCTGCQSGPGRMISGDCKLAGCCRDKGHETCETCSLKRNCGTWLDKGNIPNQRLERKQEEKEKRALIEHRAPFLGKWLWRMFCLAMASLVFNFLTGDTVVALVPVLKMPAQTGSYLCQIAIICILFVVSKEHHFYKNAALLSCVCIAINIPAVFIPEEQLWLLILIGLFQIGAAMASDYYEYKANAEVVLLVDGRISEQWDNFWNWMKYSSIGLAVSMFLIFLLPTIGALTSLVSSVGIIVARIKKLICLHHSARVFQAYDSYK